MTKIKIHITKEILLKSSTCKEFEVGQNCAFALAVRDLFPTAWVSKRTITPIYKTGTKKSFPITLEMSRFIGRFDSATEEQRLQMKEQSFELEIPDWAIEQIDISDVHKILAESKTMELVET